MRRRPHLTHGLGALALTAVVAFGLARVLPGGPLGWAAAYLLAVNAVAFGVYGYDKWQARRSGPRVPEAVLHALSLFGGGIGAYAGMTYFRHKTIKGRFRLMFWLVVLAQVAAVLAVVRLLTV